MLKEIFPLLYYFISPVKPTMLLLQPPFTKVCEPAAALAQLTAYLRENNEECFPYDMNIEGLYYLLEKGSSETDTWSKRAQKNVVANIAKVQDIKTYSNYDRYSRAVCDINRLLHNAGKEYGLVLDLANYQDNKLSPQKSVDLLYSAENFSENIFYPFFKKRIPQLIKQHQPKHIGISLNFLSQALVSFALIGFLRSNFPDIPIIIGGGLISTWCKNPSWENPFTDLIDHFITGAGEEPLLKIVSQKEPSAQPLPAHEELMQNNYLSPGYILPYAASIGCYWKKCAFCPETSENNPYFCTPEENVLKDLHSLCLITKPKLIHFLDSAISPRLMRALAANPPGVPWYGFARICKELTDPTFTKALKNSGCTMLKLGIETGSEHVMQSMHKGITVALASLVLKSLEQAGIKTYVYLLFGTPSESLEEARETLTFTREHAQAISYVNLSIFNLPVCNVSYENLETGDFYEGDLSVYTDFIHPRGWGRREVRRFLEAEFKRDASIGKILKRNPPFFTSNHAPFMKIKEA